MTERPDAFDERLLTAEGRARLTAALAQRPRALLSDVDGTLSALAATPDAAVLLPGVGALLREASAHFAVVAAVSGRAPEDARRLVGIDSLLYIGNHGLERLERVERAHEGADAGDGWTRWVAPGVEQAIPAIEATLEDVRRAKAAQWPGLAIERKGVTASIHLRQAQTPTAATADVAAFVAPLAAQRGLRMTLGKQVVELRPPVAVDKGTAVADLVRERGLRGAVYLGDDRTDIDAFRVLRRLTEEGVCAGAAVAVLHPEAPAGLAAEADIALDAIECVPAFLRWLLAQAGT